MFPNTDALITLFYKLCLNVPEPYMKSGYNKYTQFPETTHTICVSDMASGSHAHTHDLTAQKSFMCEWKLIRPSRPGSPRQIRGRDGDRPSAREQKLG